MIPVFGLLKRGGGVRVSLPFNCSEKHLLGAILENVDRVQLGPASGGAALADWLAVAICLITMAAQVLGDPRRRNTEPEQAGYLAAFCRRRRVATFPGMMVEQLAATLAFLTSLGAAVVVAVIAAGTVDEPLPRSALPRHIAPLVGGGMTDPFTPLEEPNCNS